MTFARRPGPLGRFNRRGLGSGGDWRPTQLSGCVLWLRADMGITKDGSDRVSAWADQSGSGNNIAQGVGAAQPTWTASGAGGKNYVAFDGGDHLTKASSVGSGVSTWTWYTVLRKTGAGLQRIWANGGSGDGFAIYTTAGGNRGGVLHGVTVQDDGAYTLNTDEIWCYTRDGTTARMYVNGAEQALSSATATPNAPAARFTVGGLATSSEYVGRLYEIIGYSTSHTAGERATVTAALQARYGL